MRILQCAQNQSPLSLMNTSDLPDFFILGATKCGTTSLHRYIRQHPEIFMPYKKELSFFQSEDFTRRNNICREIDNYLACFEPAGDRIAGEATPSYFRRPEVVAPNMKKFYGEWVPRFIVLLRDPVRRAYSNYKHRVQRGSETRSFEQALAEEYEDLEHSRSYWKSYFHDGLYAERLSKWWEYYPPDRFLVLLTNDLKVEADAAVREIFSFLGVRPDVKVDTNARFNQNAGRQRSQMVKRFFNSSLAHAIATTLLPRRVRHNVRHFIRRANMEAVEEPPKLDSTVARRVREQYAEPTCRLSTMIDRDLSAWLPS